MRQSPAPKVAGQVAGAGKRACGPGRWATAWRQEWVEGGGPPGEQMMGVVGYGEEGGEGEEEEEEEEEWGAWREHEPRVRFILFSSSIDGGF